MWEINYCVKFLKQFCYYFYFLKFSRVCPYYVEFAIFRRKFCVESLFDSIFTAQPSCFSVVCKTSLELQDIWLSSPREKKYVWTEDCVAAFEELKNKLISAPILKMPTGTNGMAYTTMRHDEDWGVLMQHGHVIA